MKNSALIGKSLAVAVLGVLVSAASADVLFYDGFVVGEGGYTTASVNGYAGDALSGKSSAASSGFSGNWVGATATIRMSTAGLEMPRTSYYRHSGGGLWMNYANSSYRAASHQLANMPSSGTVYFMTLMKFQDQAMDGFEDGDMALVGVRPGSSFINTVNKTQVQETSGFWFGFIKSGSGKDGTVYPAVKVNDSISRFSSVAAKADTTYICEGKIEYGAGEGGTDRLSWNIRTTAEWDAAETKEVWAGTTDAKIGQLTYFAATYLIATGNRSIWFDEIRAATTYAECVGQSAVRIDTGLPNGYRAASGTFSATVKPGDAVVAPEFVNPDMTDRTLRCCGCVIEKEVNGEWQAMQTVVDRTHSFTVPADWGEIEEPLRLTWQWDEHERLIACSSAPSLLSDIFRAAGYVKISDSGTPDDAQLNPYMSSKNLYSDTGARLFDGLTWYSGSGEVRILGYMSKAGGSYVTLNVPADVLDGGELLLYEYRLSPVSYWGNTRSRMPTAWTLSVSNAVTAADWSVADETNGVDVSRVPNVQDLITNGTKEEDARFDFPLAAPVAFTSLRFQPTDSAAYQTNLEKGKQDIDWGLLEVALLVRRVNPKGTLRVSAPGLGNKGFSHADHDLLTEAATLTAPTSAEASDGGVAYSLKGWVLETFDEATGVWTESETGIDATYDWTPDPAVRARLTWLYDRDAVMYKVTAETERTTDQALVGTYIKENVEFSPAAEGNFWAAGTEITATAIEDTTDLSARVDDSRRYRSHFIRWIGDTDGLDVDLTSSNITFTVDRSRALHAVFDREWLLIYNDGDSFMHNANWRFKASFDSGSKTVTVKNWTRGSGRLNFDTPVYGQSGAAYTITAVSDEATAYSGGKAKTTITELILPKALVSLGAQSFRMNEITNLVMDCPGLTSIGAAALARNTKLTKAIVNLPSLVRLPPEYQFFNWPLLDTDLATWNLSSLTNVPKQLLYQEAGVAAAQAAACKSGVLTLPRRCHVGSGAFENFAQAAEFHLGTGNAKLVEIADAAFKACAATNFVLGCRREIVVHQNAFLNHLKAGPDSIRFIARAPDVKETMENILASNTPEHRANVYVSAVRESDWSAYVTPVDEIDDATVKAEAEAAGATGAFKTDAGEWKALVFAVEMPFDPKGSVFLVR